MDRFGKAERLIFMPGLAIAKDPDGERLLHGWDVRENCDSLECEKFASRVEVSPTSGSMRFTSGFGDRADAGQQHIGKCGFPRRLQPG